MVPARLYLALELARILRRTDYHPRMRIPIKTGWVWSVVVGILLALPADVAQAQFACPYDESAAVADTLSPSGYYPLQVGNVSEYVRYSGPMLDLLRRDEVMADTLIDGDVFYKVRSTIFTPSGNGPITHADTVYSYRSVLEGVLLEWTPSRGHSEVIQLFRDFNTCYDLIVVEGGYDTTFTFETGQTVALTAKKKFGILGIATEEYGHGLGLIRSGGDPNVDTDLTYAQIDGQEYGVRLDSLFNIRVSVEETLHLRETARLGIYPNPSATLTYIKMALVQAGRASLRIYNVQGQLIAVPQPEDYFAAGERTITWGAGHVVPGVYILQLLIGGVPVATARLVVAR